MNTKPTLTYNCPKSFDKMTKIEESSNRFCGACEKEIVNFTKMSNEEIKLFFKKEKAGCGYFNQNQLENTKVSFFKIPLLAFIGALLLSSCYRHQVCGTYVKEPIEEEIMGKYHLHEKTEAIKNE